MGLEPVILASIKTLPEKDRKQLSQAVTTVKINDFCKSIFDVY